ncbi:hypothetical protein [Nonomuraea sp. SBT364]|uniref:hypothetical protein n=1 Tax=Nonomuraea sp. SBT364 TaxID=1580530 RepID=UPI000A4064E7|nr:hypothetical protein [Nonomuraea sp. SBT364]
MDIGGVLTSDPWQAIVLTPRLGLADRLGLDRATAASAGDALWPQFSLSTRREGDYWVEFEAAVGTPVPGDLVDAAEKEALKVNQDSAALFELLVRFDIEWGFISDNTAFWYPKQLRLLGLEDHADARLDFLSHLRGVSKSSPGAGLFELAADEVDPNTTLVIDDRAHNLARAASLGFETLHHSMDGEEPFHRSMRPHLE